MIRDTDLQLLTWGSETGPNIVTGGVVPDSYGIDQSFPPAARYYCSGKPYAGWLAKLNRPVLPNFGKLSWMFLLQVDASTPAVGSYEFDIKLAQGKLMANCSSQFLVTAGWELQISDVSGKWANTGITIPIVPGAVHSLIYAYSFDFSKQVYSIVSVTFDGVVHAIPAKMQGLAIQPTTWGDGAHLQVQQVVSSKGGAFAQVISAMELQWT